MANNNFTDRDFIEAIQLVADRCLSISENLVARWFPNGKRVGSEWVLGSLQGEPGRSLSINLNTGAWADFNSDAKGGDLVSLLAARDGIKQFDAARELAEEFHVEHPVFDRLKRKAPGPKKGTGRALAQDPRPERSKNVDEDQPAAHTGAKNNAPKAPEDQWQWQHEGIEAPRPPSKRGALTTYTYRSATGAPVMYVHRWDDAGNKSFMPETYWMDGDTGELAHRYKHPPAGKRPLYGLDRLAAMPDARVIVVEGEKAADALQAMLFKNPVVCWSAGVYGWKHSDLTPLHGRKVTLWPDADEAGLAAMSGLGQRLLDARCEVKTVNVSDLPAKADAADVDRATAINLLKSAVNFVAPEDTANPDPSPAPATLLERVRDDWFDALIDDCLLGDDAQMAAGIKRILSSEVMDRLARDPECHAKIAAIPASLKIKGAVKDAVKAAQSRWKRERQIERQNALRENPEEVELPTERSGAWVDDLIMDEEGDPLRCPHNLLLMLAGAPAFAGLRRDTFSGQMLVGQMPWRRDPGQPWSVADTGNLMSYSRKTLGFELPEATTHTMVETAADNWKTDAAQEWLNGLHWDGVPRLDSMMHRITGCADTELFSAAGRCQMIGAVRRILDPGPTCNHRVTVVLLGDQACGKSTFIRALAPRPDWFTDSIRKLSHEDTEALRLLQGKIVVELSEMRQSRNDQVEAAKAFLTSTQDDYRGLYERQPTKHNRRCVFWGSMNDGSDAVFRDESGDTRFLVVPVCTEPDRVQIDVATLTQELEQLYAEARDIYLDWRESEESEDDMTAPNYIPKHLWGDAAETTREHAVGRKSVLRDAVLDIVSAYGRDVTHVNGFKMDAVFRSMDLKMTDWDRMRKQVGAVLRDAGYENKAVRIGDAVQKRWFAPSEDDEN